ncbi:transposase [Candidatus Bipolaricaulota bacterium]|nr:transposase [Candidatus Bipolaricaulota bacterium]
MARPLRVEFPGAIYHITSRGNAGQAIFLDDKDRLSFLDLLAEVVKRYRFLCYSYCLMKNHYHLLIETQEGNLSQGMRQLNGVYTQAFNRRHKRSGHLFQGRYKAILVEKDAYLLEVARYIVLNPVRAGLVKHPGKWRWSSYRATAGLGDAPPFLAVDWLLAQFARERTRAQNAYRRFVAQGKGVELWDKLKGGVILGDEAFVAKVKPLLEEKRDIPEIPRREKLADRLPLEELFTGVKTKDERDAKICQAVLEYGYRLAEVGEYLGLHYSTISRIVGRRNSKVKT